MASSALNDRFHINYIIYLVACIPKIVISNLFMLYNHLHIFICMLSRHSWSFMLILVICIVENGSWKMVLTMVISYYPVASAIHSWVNRPWLWAALLFLGPAHPRKDCSHKIHKLFPNYSSIPRLNHEYHLISKVTILRYLRYLTLI